MPKKKQRPAARQSKGQSPAKGRSTVIDPRKQGMKAFSANSFDAAITCWSELNQNDSQVQAALAEAYFRRALTHSLADNQVADLREAVKRVPDDGRYRYHLGLALHRAGDIEQAIDCYEAVLQSNPKWSGVGMVLALAHLTRDASTDLAALPGSTPEVRAALEPVQMLLRGETPPLPQDEALNPLQMLWHGLGLIRAGDGSALDVLSDTGALSSPRAQAVRRMYQGVAAAQTDDLEGAIRVWQHTYDDHIITSPILHHNLVAALVRYFQDAIDEGSPEEMASLASWVVHSSLQHSALDPLLVKILDSAARAAAEEGEWQQAVLLWEDARQIVSASSSLGSPRMLLHNLAIAYEALEEWVAAAEMWRAMMRTRPRKTASTDKKGAADDTLAYQDEHWAWIRKRIITCYQRAGEPGEAVKVFRTAIKSDPHDLDMRIQLSDALLANQQEQASLNELYRILEIDPEHTEAHLRLAEIYSASNQWGAAEQSLRTVLNQQPEREDVRRQIARLIMLRGNHLHNFGMLDAAEKIFKEGRAFAPNDYQFPLNLARIAIDRNQLEQVEPLLEQVLHLGADDPTAFVYVIDCWVVAEDLDRARAVLEQAERDLTLDADFYIDLTKLLFSHSAPASPMAGIFGMPAPAQKEENGPLQALAREVLDRAVAKKPDDPTVRLQLATELMPVNPGIAEELAEQAVEMTPDEPAALLLLGLLQGLNEHTREAKATLRKAAKTARQQGFYDLADQAEELRSQVGSPFFRLSLQMGMVAPGFEGGLDDFDDFDDDLDFFL